MLRYEYDNNSNLSTDLTYRLYVYPQFPPNRDFVNDNGEVNALWYVELGVIDFESVTIYDSDVTHPDIGATLDASRPASVRALIPRVGEQHELWLQNTRFHHLGPSPNPVDEDFSNNRPVNVISGSRSLTNTYRDICSCVVGRDDVFEAGGSNYRRLTYTLRALIIATYPTQDPGDPVPFDITLKLTLSDPNLSNTMSQTLAVDAMPCIRSPTSAVYPDRLDDGPMRQRQRGPLRQPRLSPRLWSSIRHDIVSTPHLEGVLPERDTGRRNLFDVEINIEDTEATITRRIATLSALRSERTSDNRPIGINGQAPRLHVLTWSVITTSHRRGPSGFSGELRAWQELSQRIISMTRPATATRIALGRTIGQSGEVADFVERPNFLYASSNLRAIFERYYLPALETTSTVAIVLPSVLFANEHDER